MILWAVGLLQAQTRVSCYAPEGCPGEGCPGEGSRMPIEGLECRGTGRLPQ